jgi:histidinol-phosphate aminotransferase
MNSLIRECIREMAGYVPGEQPKAGGIIKLNTNENPYPPSPRVGQALANLAAEGLRLYPDPVSADLRRQIADIHGADISQVFVGNGSDEILGLCTRAFVEDDGAIGYFNPSYSLYPVLADIRDVQKHALELGPGFEWSMRPGFGCSLFFMTNPNAPTGMLYPFGVVEEFCTGFSGVVLIDEAYVDFSRGSCMALALRLPNVLVLRTLSKSFSLAGLRVGYVVGSTALIQALFKVKDSYNMDRVAQALAAAALSDLPYMQGNVRKIVSTRERLSKALSDMGHRVYPSETNFLWVQPAGISAGTLFDALRVGNIMIRHFKGVRTSDFVRITVGTDDEVDTLLRAMKGILP